MFCVYLFYFFLLEILILYSSVNCSNYSEDETSGLEILIEHIMNEVSDFLSLLSRIQIKNFRNAEKLLKKM